MYYINTWNQPVCPYPPKEGLSNQNKGHLGFRHTLYTFLFSQHDLCPHALLSEQGVRNRVMFGDRTLPDLAYTVYCNILYTVAVLSQCLDLLTSLSADVAC